MDCKIEVIETNGAAGAARGAAIGHGTYNMKSAFDSLTSVRTYTPDQNNKEAYQSAYTLWKKVLDKQLENT